MDRVAVHFYIRGCQDEQLESRCDLGDVSSVSSCQLVVVVASY